MLNNYLLCETPFDLVIGIGDINLIERSEETES